MDTKITIFPKGKIVKFFLNHKLFYELRPTFPDDIFFCKKFCKKKKRTFGREKVFAGLQVFSCCAKCFCNMKKLLGLQKSVRTKNQPAYHSFFFDVQGRSVSHFLLCTPAFCIFLVFAKCFAGFFVVREGGPNSGVALALPGFSG